MPFIIIVVVVVAAPPCPRSTGPRGKIVRNEFREVERLRGMECFQGSETQFVGNTITNG